MSEDVSRAVGAPGPGAFLIKGKECRPRPLNMKELGELERDCIQQYRKSSVQSYEDSLRDSSFFSQERKEELLLKKMEEAAALDLKSLPSRIAYDPRKIKLTGELKEWLRQNMDGYFPEGEESTRTEKVYRSIASAALDGDHLSEAEYKTLTGIDPKRTRVSYVNWWVTGSFDGRLAMVALAFRGEGITKTDVSDALGNKPALLLEASRAIEELTAPAVGNG